MKIAETHESLLIEGKFCIIDISIYIVHKFYLVRLKFYFFRNLGYIFSKIREIKLTIKKLFLMEKLKLNKNKTFTSTFDLPEGFFLSLRREKFSY